MLDWVLIDRMVFGLEHARPSGLVLTWVLFGATFGVSISMSYVLACLSQRFRGFGFASASGFTLFRGIPPLILIFAVDYFVAGPLLMKAVVALTLYSMSHLYPVFAKFMRQYPDRLNYVEHVLRIGFFRRYFWFRLHWVMSRSLPAVHTHLISLFKDTSIVIIIGMLELSAITKLMASRTYDITEWIGVFATCALLYFVNVQIVSALCLAVRSALRRAGAASRSIYAT